MAVPMPQLPAFDALAAHEDRLVRLEDALLESAKQTAELSGCMRSFESKLEVMMDGLNVNLARMSAKMDSSEDALSDTMKRLEALEARKVAETASRAKWVDVAQKIALYAGTGIIGAIGGWLMKVFVGT